MYGGHQLSGQQDMEALYEGVLDRFKAEIERGQVVILRQRSVDAAVDIADSALDFVYIDGDHTYASVKTDLETYYRVVKSGGFLAGDDYGDSGWWEDGVSRAVDEFATPERCHAPETFSDQFLMRKL